MNKAEALKILGLSEGASETDIKKAFKKQAAAHHPDVNKEEDATEKFKIINEAHQYLQSGVEDHNFNPFHSDMQPRQRIVLEQIHLTTTISFKESVLGCKKDIKYNRKNKCNECDGRGAFLIHNGCNKCNGSGQISRRQGNMQFSMTCDLCHGRMKTEKCKKCTSGLIDSESSVQVSVPGGIQNGNTLRLQGMGHFLGSTNHIFMNMEQFSDVYLSVNVIQDPILKIVDNDVICPLSISLSEAVKGCTKTVSTIIDNKEIKIPIKSRHKDEIVIPSYGVNRKGNQRVILNVEYPDNIDELIEGTS